MWDVVIGFLCCVFSLCGYKDRVLVLYIYLLIKIVYEVAQLDCVFFFFLKTQLDCCIATIVV